MNMLNITPAGVEYFNYFGTHGLTKTRSTPTAPRRNFRFNRRAKRMILKAYSKTLTLVNSNPPPQLFLLLLYIYIGPAFYEIQARLEDPREHQAIYRFYY